MDYRQELTRARARLRDNYAGLIDLGNRMRQKGMVQWSKTDHCWYTYFYNDRRGKDRKAITLLMELQKLIKSEAMLLLELEYAIDREEAKGNE